MNEMFDAALRWRDDGRRVFPVVANGKAPATEHGFKDASADEAQIRKWFGNGRRRNLGVATGDGLLVIDVDVKNGRDGFATLASLGLRDTKTVSTPSGGQHLYFSVTEDLPSSVGTLGPGLDVRCSGGYVVAPPSTINGRPYAWEDDLPMITLPDAVVQRIREGRTAGDFHALDGEPVPIGMQETTLNSRACSYRYHGLSREGAIAALWTDVQAWEEDPKRRPWTLADVEAKVAHAWQDIEPGPATPAPDSANFNVEPAANCSLETNGKLAWLTASEFCARVPDEIDWICEPYIAAGDIVELDGQPKRAGKSTLIAHATRAITHGAGFLGGKTKQGHVVWLTEMDGSTLRECLTEGGLLSNNSLHLLRLSSMRGKSWAEIVAVATAKCREVGAVLLVVDTVARWLRVHGEEGNASGTWTERIEPLSAVTELGTAVALLHWDRKSGGSVGESGAGNASLQGSVDVVLRLSRIDGGTNTRHRRLEAIGRHSATPEDVVIDLEPGQGYVLVGEGRSAVRDNARDLVLAVMRASDDGQPFTVVQLVTATDKTRATIQRVLTWMTDHDEAVMEPGGHVKGQRGGTPATYRLSHRDRHAD